MNKLIIANWKNHPETLEEAKELFEFEVAEALKYPNIKTIICPPEHFLKSLIEINIEFVGAQDVFWEPGADNYQVKFALVGHSDRRKAGETDEIVNQKLKQALIEGVVSVLLVGEKKREDDSKMVLEEQLSKCLAGLSATDAARVLIAYEPVWAISTNPNAEPDEPENTLIAAEVIKQVTGKESILYGGSVNQNNVENFLKHPEISGAVIGGASLRKEEFANILKIASEL